jgi:hypothetical protein
VADEVYIIRRKKRKKIVKHPIAYGVVGAAGGASYALVAGLSDADQYTLPASAVLAIAYSLYISRLVSSNKGVKKAANHKLFFFFIAYLLLYGAALYPIEHYAPEDNIYQKMISGAIIGAVLAYYVGAKLKY